MQRRRALHRELMKTKMVSTCGWLWLCFCVSGCSFSQWGRDLGEGLTEGAKQDADTIGTKLGSGVIRGVRDTLTSPETEKRLTALIEQLGRTLAQEAAASRDTLLGEQTREWLQQLKDEFLGRNTRDQIGEIRDELLGARTTAFLKDTMLAAVASLRDEILDATTRSVLDLLVSSAIATLSKEYRERMQPLVREEESFLKRNVTELLWTAGGVVAAILVLAGIIFVRKKRDGKLLNLLAFQIHEIPNQQSYEELVDRVQKRAQEAEVEPALRGVLTSLGVLGGESWRPQKTATTR